MTTPSIWDSVELKPDGDYIRFDAVGDTASGVVQAITVHRWDDGSISPKIHLVTDEGDEKTLTVGQIKLKVLLAEKRPEVGDHLRIVLTQIERRAGGKTLKHFDAEVTKGGQPAQVMGAATTAAPAPAVAPAAAAAPAAAPAVDPAALAAALAGLTPEQKIALGVTA